jgi:hypothetical protein
VLVRHGRVHREAGDRVGLDSARSEQLERFAARAVGPPQAYIDEQRYARKPSPADVSAEGARILDALLGDGAVESIVDHPVIRLHVIAARFRHLGALEGRLQLLGLALAASLNAVHRPALAAGIERVVFDAGADPGPFAPWRDLPTRHCTLTRDNLKQALDASAAISAVMVGVRDPHRRRNQHMSTSTTLHHADDEAPAVLHPAAGGWHVSSRLTACAWISEVPGIATPHSKLTLRPEFPISVQIFPV